MGTIQIELFLGNCSIFHEFHVVPKEFNIPSDGIIVKDFLKYHECDISFRKRSLKFFLNDTTISIPILDGPDFETLVLPARAEVFRIFTISKFNGTQFIPNHEISPGVFVSNSIADSENAIIRVINTTDSIKIIPKTISISQNLSDFNTFTVSKSENTSTRFKELTKFFFKNTPKHYQSSLFPLLEKYSDIFAISTATYD